MRVSGVDVGKRIIGEVLCVFVSLCLCVRVVGCRRVLALRWWGDALWCGGVDRGDLGLPGPLGAGVMR